MNKAVKKKFNWRAFTSLYMTFSFIIMILSGIILYIAPAGRIAHWTHIYILGLEKDAWQAIHTIFTFLFILAGGFHIWYNWKPFVFYLRTRMQQKITLRKELFISSFTVIFLIVFTLLEIPPFSSVIELGETITDSWATEASEPPVPHAESMTFAELAKITNTALPDLIDNLKRNGIIVQQDETVQNAADRYKLSPSQLFVKMKAAKISPSTSPYAGGGVGRKTLQEVCENVHVDLEIAVKRLKENGIKATSEMKIKDIARVCDINPVDIMKIINPNLSGE